jgi:hypothetical protein
VKIHIRKKLIIIKKKPTPTIQVRHRKKMVPCGLCGGRNSDSCHRCRGIGLMPQHGPIIRKPLVSPVSIRKPLTAQDLNKHGFYKTGVVVERASIEVLGRYLRMWLTAPSHVQPYLGEKAHWEHQLAQTGWIRNTPSWESIVQKYKPTTPVQKIPEKKTKTISITRR